MNDQLFVKRSKPDRALLEKIRNDEHLGIKPRGGLWTSTFDERTGSGWVQWCLDELWAVPRGFQWHAWRLVPYRDIEVLEIDTYEDLRRTVEERHFGRPSGLDDNALALDYEKLAERYDAIHLTDAGQWATRLSHPHSLYGWDCESVLWLHWAIAEVHDLGIREWGKPAPVPQAGVIRRARRGL